MIDLKLKGEVRELVATDDYHPKEWAAFVVFAHRDYIKKQPDTVRGAVKALLQANGYIRKNPQWSIEKMKKLSGYSEEAAKVMYQHLVQDFTKDGKIGKKRLENVRDFAIEYGIIFREKIPPVDFMYTAEFIE